MLALHDSGMLKVRHLHDQTTAQTTAHAAAQISVDDLRALSPAALAAAAEQMFARISAQSKQIDDQAQTFKFKDAKLEKIIFELARLKAWRFGAKTEAMNAEQRQMFEDTLGEIKPA